MEEPRPSVGARRVGEVIEATTSGLTAQCYQLYDAPPLGALVRSGGDSHVYGVVYEVATRSMDPARRPIARGQDEDSEERVYLNNPQLTRLLFTEFLALVVGHRTNDDVRRYLAPVPPRIYSFVYQCGSEELRTVSSSLDFIPLLLDARISAADDVVASFLRQASACHPDPERFLVGAGKELAANLGGQLHRLNIILRRISP